MAKVLLCLQLPSQLIAYDIFKDQISVLTLA